MDEVGLTANDRRIIDLEEELRGFINQYSCKCGHPHCVACADTRDALLIINAK